MAFVWLSGLPVALAARDVAEQAKFHPAAAVSVSAIPEQPLSAQNGTLVLDVRVSATGEVADIAVRRDLAPLTEEAIRAVKTWKFEPAKLEGRRVASRITVAVNFNPPSASSADVPLPPLLPQEDETRVNSSFQPAEVTFAKMPAFVYGALNPGTVVVAVTVNEEGKVQSTKVLRDAPPFTAHAVQAAASWRFVPATLKGKPLPSTVVIAFVFRIFNMPPALPY
jgi:TonB family protein